MTTPKTQFPIARSETFTPPAEVRDAVPEARTARLPSSAQVGLVFLLLTVVGFIALGAALPHYTLSSTARRGLTYDTLFSELHDALIDEPDRPLRRAIRAVQVDALVPAPKGYTVVTFDTLAADPTVYPSLEPGGFLHDEIDRFNTFQRERLDAVRRGRLTGGAVMDLRAAENPSIFRTEIRALDDGRAERDSIVLAERAVPYGLRVPSPFDAARLVAVTTREWSRTLGWISAKGAQSVRANGTVPGVPPCPFRAVKDSVYVECTARIAVRAARIAFSRPPGRDRYGHAVHERANSLRRIAVAIAPERSDRDGRHVSVPLTGVGRSSRASGAGDSRVDAGRHVRRYTMDQRPHSLAAERLADVAIRKATGERRRLRGECRARGRPQHSAECRRGTHRRSPGRAR